MISASVKISSCVLLVLFLRARSQEMAAPGTGNFSHEYSVTDGPAVSTSTVSETITKEVLKPTTQIYTQRAQDIDRSSHVHIKPSPQLQGFWKKKVLWRPRWAKSWEARRVYTGVWKRVWGPVVVKEWVPLPNPPPGWAPRRPHAIVLKKYPHIG